MPSSYEGGGVMTPSSPYDGDTSPYEWGRSSKRNGSGVSQNGLGFVRIAAIGLMQHQRRRLPQVEFGAAPCTDQNARRGRQALDRDLAPAEPRQMARDLLQPVGAMNDREGAVRFQRAGCDVEPAGEIGAP